jgi:hypothetical protein
VFFGAFLRLIVIVNFRAASLELVGDCMQCSSIPKRHEEGAFVARFGIEYICVF